MKIAVFWVVTDVSEVLPASIIRAISDELGRIWLEET
jgi:hypothetical protein